MKLFRIFGVVHGCVDSQAVVKPLAAQAGLVIVRLFRLYREAGGLDGGEAGDQVVSHTFVALGVESKGHDVVRELILQTGLTRDDVIDILRRLAEGGEVDDSVVIVVGVAALLAIHAQARE